MKGFMTLLLGALTLFMSVHVAEAANSTELGSQTLSNINGRLGVNMVAGDNNQQSNIDAVAISGPAIITSSQKIQAITNLDGHQGVAIQAGALSHSSGLIAISQGAGEANQQLNVFAMSLNDPCGIGTVTDINLSTSIAKVPSNKANTATTSIYLDDTALTGSKGVIQVNQVAGLGNQAVNMVSLPLGGAVTTLH